jgi:hypothetical protein
VKHRRYTRRPTYTDREMATIAEAYQLLGALLVPLKGGNVRILDNLADMSYGQKPRWRWKKLHDGSTENMALLVPLMDAIWPRKPKDG